MTAIHAAAVLLALCSVSVPGMAQNGRPVTSNAPSALPAPPPPDAIPGYLNLDTRQFTPLTASPTQPKLKITVIDKVFTFTPNFKPLIDSGESTVIHTISCFIAVFPDFQLRPQPGSQSAMNQFDGRNPPAPLSIPVFLVAYGPDPMLAVKLNCHALDDYGENHEWENLYPSAPVDIVPTNYKDAVIF